MERFDKVTPANLPLENMSRTKVDLVFDITLQNDFGNAFRWSNIHALDILPSHIPIELSPVDHLEVVGGRHHRLMCYPSAFNGLHIRKLLL